MQLCPVDYSQIPEEKRIYRLKPLLFPVTLQSKQRAGLEKLLVSPGLEHQPLSEHQPTMAALFHGTR